MRPNVLGSIRIWTIATAFVVANVLWFAISFAFGLGVFLTALWAVAGFRALEGVLRASVVPPGASRDHTAVILWFLAKLAVYGVAVWVLFSRPFPPLSHAVGFTILIVVLMAIGARQLPDVLRVTTPEQDRDELERP